MDMKTGKIAPLEELQAAGAEIESLHPGEQRILEQVDPDHRAALLREMRKHDLFNPKGRGITTHTVDVVDEDAINAKGEILLQAYRNRLADKRHLGKMELIRRRDKAKRQKKARAASGAARKARRAGRGK